MEKDIRAVAKDHALKRLNRRECSSRDIYLHLTKKGIPSDIASTVVEDLKKLNLINDERFAKLLTREQASRGKGPYVIRQKLKDKGITLDLGQMKILSEEVTNTTELDSAKNLVMRKYPEAWKDKKDTARALQTLLRRGFSYSVAREALSSPATDDLSPELPEIDDEEN